MRGSVALITVPYEDIGNVELDPPTRSGVGAWTVRLRSAGNPFPETWTSPERKTAKGALGAAYFLYHQELGR